MTIHLDHTLVPARDKEASAKWFAEIFGLTYEGPWAAFAPVQIDEYLCIDFQQRDDFDSHHYAFLVADGEFDAILQRVREVGITYGSGPRDSEDMEINNRHQGRGFYFHDPNGHLLEVITHTYVR